MPDAEDLAGRIRRRTAPSFRGRLLARGQSRALIWRDGIVPDDGPNYADGLSYDLLSYGYALLSEGLRLLEIQGPNAATSQALERAAEAIESVLRNGDGDLPERDLNVLVAAGAYHVAGFAARAYSLVADQNFAEDHPLAGRALVLLMMRRLDALKGLVASTLPRMDVDIEVAESLSDAERTDLAYDVLDDLFLQAVSTALVALDHGSVELLTSAQNMLEDSAALAGAGGYVEQWWIHYLARFILGGLWDASLHTQIPGNDNPGFDSMRWNRLRSFFIAMLLSRDRAEIELWPSQIEAAARVFQSSASLVLSLPTSAGKTRIAELCVLKTLAEGRRVVFVTPLRALSAQTEASLTKTFGPMGYSVSSLYGGMGLRPADLDLAVSVDILVATPEKLDFAVRSDPGLLDDVGLVVLDEGHMIGPREREIRYEAQVQRLLRRDDASTRRIICLSAVLTSGPDLDDFCGWLTSDADDPLVANTWTPTRRRFGHVTWNGTVGRLDLNLGEELAFVPALVRLQQKPLTPRRSRKFPRDQGELALSVALQLADDGHSVLLYAPQKDWVNKLARTFVELHDLGFIAGFDPSQTPSFLEAVLVAEELFGAKHAITRCLLLGIAVHHGSLPSAFRLQIEGLLRDGILRMTVSSPTLTQGINLSATSLVFYSLYSAGHVISGADFRNVIGRAGRAYADVEGLILLPIFDVSKQRNALKQWRQLQDGSRQLDMQSGLARLVAQLIERLTETKSLSGSKAIVEYLLNQSRPFEWAIQDDSDPADLRALDSLDSAILSVLGDESIKPEDLAKALDDVLTGSLWARTLSRMGEDDRALRKMVLTERAEALWADSTPRQRRGLYLAGVGLTSSQKMNPLLPQLEAFLLTAESAIEMGDESLAVTALVSFAAVAFQFTPFKPKSLPENWEKMLEQWLFGDTIRVAETEDPLETMDFIEEAVGYHLVWAMEAVRFMAPHFAEAESDVDTILLEVAPSGQAVAAAQAGSLNSSVILLLQAGLASREAARQVVADLKPDFTSLATLRSWLTTERLEEYTADPSQPSAELHDVWSSFVQRVALRESSQWARRDFEVEVSWSVEAPGVGSAVIVTGDGLQVRSPDFTMLGTLTSRIDATAGRLQAVVNDTGNLNVTQIGPGVSPFDIFA